MAFLFRITMQDIIQKRTQSIQNFKNFCAFLASEYNINVYTHRSIQASTDGRSIFVPDVANLSPTQIDFVYSSVLHEVGHIEHSTFDKAIFSQLHNDIIATLWNVLEDSRMEGCVCLRYFGGKDIFDNSHKLFISQNSEIMEMLNIEWEFKDISFFKCFTLWLYTFSHEYVNHDVELLKANMPEKSFSEMERFLAKTKFETKFANIKKRLLTTEDALTIAFEIYELICKFYPANKSFNTLADMEKGYKAVGKHIKQMKSFVENLLGKINKEETNLLNHTINENNALAKILKENAQNEQDISSLTSKIKQNHTKINKILSILSTHDLIAINDTSIQNTEEKKKQRSTKIQELNEKQQDLSQAIKNLTEKLNQLEDIPKNEKKISKLKENINKKKSLLEKAHTRSEKAKEMQEKDDEKIIRSEGYIDKFTNHKKAVIKEFKEIKGKSDEEILEFVQPIIDETELLQAELSKKEVIRYEYMEEYRNLLSEKTEIKDKIRQLFFSVSSCIFYETTKIDYILNKNELAKTILPKVVHSIPWETMNKFQQEEDKSRSFIFNTVFIDGQDMCNNEENIQWLIEAIEEKYKKIDPVSSFKKINTPCMKDLIEIMQTEDFYEETETSNTTAIKHNVSNKSYDETLYEKKAKPLEKVEDEVLFKKNLDKIELISDCIAHGILPKNKTNWQKNKKSGQVDGNNLWKTALGDSNIFKKQLSRKEANYAATILIDLSSSNILYENSLKDIKIFTKAISDTLIELEIPHDIVGYYNPINIDMIEEKNHQFNRNKHSMKTIIYKDFNDYDNDGISNIKIKVGDNSDGEALEFVSKRLNNQISNKKLVFFLSDFLPYIEQSNYGLIETHINNTVMKMDREQVKIYGFNPANLQKINNVNILQKTIHNTSKMKFEQFEKEEVLDFIETIGQ